MNSKNSGGWLEAFLTGRGFYIVLFLCAAVIGASAWMLAADHRAAEEDVIQVSNPNAAQFRGETVIEPAREERPGLRESLEEAAQAVGEQTEEEEVREVFREESPAVNPVYAWPVQGEVARLHDAERLYYDRTLGDWRTHQGIDILAPLGQTVTAAHAGSVVSVENSDLMGTVVTVSHGDGVCTVYANLEENPAVSVGDWVEPGSVIGAVGQSALSEISQDSHLHFAVLEDGAERDPLEFLPA